MHKLKKNDSWATIDYAILSERLIILPIIGIIWIILSVCIKKTIFFKKNASNNSKSNSSHDARVSSILNENIKLFS